MNAREVTHRLAQVMGLGGASWQAGVDALFAALEPEMTEWSLNAADDPRGELRVACWSRDAVRVRDAMVRVEQPFAQALCSAVAGASEYQGIGVAASQSLQTFRWWALSRRYGGENLARVASQAGAELAAELDVLARSVGGMSQVRAVSAEGLGEMSLRHTIYASLPRPEVAVRLLEHIGCPVTLRGNLFFKALLGLEPGRSRPWPVVWAGRSVGASSGWKFYYFARRDPYRVSDEAILDLVDAGSQLQAAWHVLSDAATPAERQRGLVQFVGLTMLDALPDAEPRWTVYMAPA